MATSNQLGQMLQASSDQESQYFKNNPSGVTATDTPQQAQAKRDAQFSQMIKSSIGHDNPGQYWPAAVPKISQTDTPDQVQAKRNAAFQQMIQNSIAHERQQMQQRMAAQPQGGVPLAGLAPGLGLGGL